MVFLLLEEVLFCLMFLVALFGEVNIVLLRGFLIFSVSDYAIIGRVVALNFLL